MMQCGCINEIQVRILIEYTPHLNFVLRRILRTRLEHGLFGHRFKRGQTRIIVPAT